MIITNVYLGGQGLNGLYLEGIIKGQASQFKKVYSIQSFHSRFERFKCPVYIISDSFISYKLPARLRLGIRYIEFIFALVYIYFFTLFSRVTHLNYSINLYRPEELFLIRLLKKHGTKIMITVHDANLHSNNHSSQEKRIQIRNKILTEADKIIVHNNFSETELRKNFRNAEIIIHPYPFVKVPEKLVKRYSKNRVSDYLFIGHARLEKGIEFLIQLWKESFFNEKKLKIYGSDPFGILQTFKTNRFENIRIHSRFIDENELIKLLCSNKYLILPYKMGTNSLFPFFALSCGCIPIMSDVPAFQFFVENSKLTFKSGNENSLQKTIADLESKEINTSEVIELYQDYYFTKLSKISNRLYN